MSNHTFIMDLRVLDPALLHAAALAHPDCCDGETLLDSKGEIDIAACLIMLLDPSVLPGCKIDESRVE